MGCSRLLPKASKKFWFKDKYFSFITWYNYLHTCPSCLLRVRQDAVGPQFSPWRLTSFWIYMSLGKKLFMPYRFYIVLSLPPWLWNTNNTNLDWRMFFFIPGLNVTPLYWRLLLHPLRLDIKMPIYVPFMAIGVVCWRAFVFHRGSLRGNACTALSWHFPSCTYL